jgi:hypothetical protein
MSLVSGLTMSTTVSRNADEPPTRVTLFTPGQRGVMQSLMGMRMGARRIKPTLDRVQESSKIVLKKNKRRIKVRTALKDELSKTTKQCSAIVARISAGDATLETTLKVLERIARGLSHIQKAVDMEDEAIAEMGDGEDKDGTQILQEAIESNQHLASELRQQMTDATSLSESWMRIKWTKDSTTAVGRGPPGYIAFSPFTAHDPLFEKTDVVQLLTETNRRAGGSGITRS